MITTIDNGNWGERTSEEEDEVQVYHSIGLVVKLNLLITIIYLFVEELLTRVGTSTIDTFPSITLNGLLSLFPA